MTTLPERQLIVELIQEAVQSGATAEPVKATTNRNYLINVAISNRAQK